MNTIRYGAMPDDGCESLLHGCAGDVNELLRKLPRLQVCLLSDGAHDLVAHLQTEVGGRVDRGVQQGVDFWHLVEKLRMRRHVRNRFGKLMVLRLSPINHGNHVNPRRILRSLPHGQRNTSIANTCRNR